MELKWIVRNNDNSTEISKLAQEINVSEPIARILYNRGVTDFESARRFFRADVDELNDPFLFNQMELAADRIIHALKNDEKIMIYGDYDVDGITSVSLMIRVLRDELKCDPLYYIPDRQAEGYGISLVGINDAQGKDVSLIISVDCGITALEEIEAANAAGIDVIIVDHHEAGPELPKAYAILDPKCENENYPFKELAGVGVVYKLLQGLFARMKLNDKVLKNYTDFVALGSAADIVPLIDENRILVRAGLKEITNQKKNTGLQALITSAGLKDKAIGTGQIVFMVAPRINAVGRMGDASRAVHLLTTDNEQQAKNIAAILESENRTRKAIDEQTFTDALDVIEKNFEPEKVSAFVLSAEGWHSGVIGIVASRIVEKYYRPTVLIAVEDGVGKGSARSIPGFDLYEALKECQDLMIGFGGHKYAAGLTIKAENIAPFQKRLEQVAAGMMDEEMKKPKLHIEDEIRLKEIDTKFFRILKQFAPFGPQNMRPVFMSKNLEIVGTPAVVGKNHLKFKVRQDGVVMDAIGFNLGHLLYRLAPGDNKLHIAYVIDENEWQGQVTIQLRIKDLV